MPHMLEIEAGNVPKNQAAYYLKRLDTGQVFYFSDLESARILAFQLERVCPCSIRPMR